tara:strand:+ start:780 stop:1010 length:231 start_codon:yes stop_codon:yes gene_type:complete
MSEANDELVMLLKELVDKVNNLEKAVYDKDNLLMKSGYVVVDSPTPDMNITKADEIPDVSSMEWKDVHAMIENYGG